DGGADALLYPLRALHGAELIVDDMVAARVMRDEPRRVLDQINAAAGRVTLRLLFDDPRHPDFSLELWAPEDAHRREARTAAATIREARGWLGRAEAILRRTAPPAAAPTPVSAPPMVPEHEAGGPMPPLAPSHPPERPPSSERPPWEDEPDEDRIEDNEFEPDDDAANALRPEDHNPPRLL
ncbi:MAG: hypothetical protein JO303_07100, partial [Caulobacteraceae bacterium]|nr:hypothetical protein [Caulobacteraceae bacterium]